MKKKVLFLIILFIFSNVLFLNIPVLNSFFTIGYSQDINNNRSNTQINLKPNASNQELLESKFKNQKLLEISKSNFTTIELLKEIENSDKIEKLFRTDTDILNNFNIDTSNLTKAESVLISLLIERNYYQKIENISNESIKYINSLNDDKALAFLLFLEIDVFKKYNKVINFPGIFSFYTDNVEEFFEIYIDNEVDNIISKFRRNKNNKLGINEIIQLLNYLERNTYDNYPEKFKIANKKYDFSEKYLNIRDEYIKDKQLYNKELIPLLKTINLSDKMNKQQQYLLLEENVYKLKKGLVKNDKLEKQYDKFLKKINQNDVIVDSKFDKMFVGLFKPKNIQDSDSLITKIKKNKKLKKYNNTKEFFKFMIPISLIFILLLILFLYIKRKKKRVLLEKIFKDNNIKTITPLNLEKYIKTYYFDSPERYDFLKIKNNNEVVLKKYFEKLEDIISKKFTRDLKEVKKDLLTLINRNMKIYSKNNKLHAENNKYILLLSDLFINSKDNMSAEIKLIETYRNRLIALINKVNKNIDKYEETEKYLKNKNKEKNEENKNVSKRLKKSKKVKDSELWLNEQIAKIDENL